MNMTLTFFIWVLIGIATGYFAYQRGRDPFIWFMIGMLLGLLGLLILFMMPAVGSESVPEDELEEVLSDRSTVSKPADEGVVPILSKEWFYILPGEGQQGPISFDQLKSLWSDDRLSPDTYVWSEGMERWKHIGEIDQLKKLLVS